MHSILALFAALAAVLFFPPESARAAGASIGLSISVDGDGFFLNPVVNKVVVSKVEKPSLAEAAGIVAGDEITEVDGQAIKGRRGLELQPLMKFEPGETRTLRLTHANGESFEARLTKPKD